MDINSLDYTIRYSKRAKYISMRIVPSRGLEVILPWAADKHAALSFLQQNTNWLARHADLLDKASIERERLRDELISEIDLKCINSIYRVRYLKRSTKRITLHEPVEGVLILSGLINDAHSCEPHISTWLKQKGRKHLLPMLDTLSQETGLSYNSATVRLQRARWGSCSSKGDISLNARLLYHPPEVVRYVLIHELCHLKELNHSKRFWRLVERHEPNYRHLKSLLV